MKVKAMFFSTDLSKCARKGELVCIRGNSIPYPPAKVKRRFKKKEELGQVYFELVDPKTDKYLATEKVEPFSFWPCQGDIVLFSIAPYLDWLADQLQVQAKAGNTGAIAQIERRLKAYGAYHRGPGGGAQCDRTGKVTGSIGGDVTALLDKHVIEVVEGELAIVSSGGGGKKEKKKAPLNALIVIEKSDGRKGR